MPAHAKRGLQRRQTTRGDRRTTKPKKPMKNPTKIRIKEGPFPLQRVTNLPRHIKALELAAQKMRNREYAQMSQRLKERKGVRENLRRLREIDRKLEHLIMPRKQHMEEMVYHDRKFPAVLTAEAFKEEVQKRLVRGKEKDKSIIMIDIDHFKKVNDSHGHAIGDEVLRIFTETFRGLSNANHGFAGRWGGEELIVYVPLQSKDVLGFVRRLSEEMNRRFNANPKLKKKIGTLPTFSAGVSTMHKGYNYNKLMERADDYLYASKDFGRNAVTFFDETGLNHHKIDNSK